VIALASAGVGVFVACCVLLLAWWIEDLQTAARGLETLTVTDERDAA
jgi:hypothetical protein